MLVKTYSSTVFGINATTITIEVNLEIGINFYLVGLPDNAVKESQQRIKAAFKNNNLKFPGREITVNMAPADIRKEGSVFDLPIAIGILAVSKQVKLELLSNYILIGELSLDGSIQATRGVLAIALQAFIPELSSRMLDILNVDKKHRGLKYLSGDFALKAGHKINEPKGVFPRLESAKNVG